MKKLNFKKSKERFLPGDLIIFDTHWIVDQLHKRERDIVVLAKGDQLLVLSSRLVSNDETIGILRGKMWSIIAFCGGRHQKLVTLRLTSGTPFFAFRHYHNTKQKA